MHDHYRAQGAHCNVDVQLKPGRFPVYGPFMSSLYPKFQIYWRSELKTDFEVFVHETKRKRNETTLLMHNINQPCNYHV